MCERFLPEHFGGVFSRQRMPLVTGGDHSFAAVSADRRIVGTITTAAAAGPAGKLAVGKLNKVRADLYFLLLAEADKKFLVDVQPIMHQFLIAEQAEYKRIPADVEIIHADLPTELADLLRAAQQAASAEMLPASLR